MKDLPEIELTIKDRTKHGTFAMSLVDEPAIEDDFVYLSEQKIELKVVDEERRIVVGYALIPDKRIPRVMPKVNNGEPFNIYFSKETVAESAHLFMTNLNLKNFTVDHKKPVKGISVIESWVTEDVEKDKISLYGIKPKLGGWALMSKIDNEEEWQDIKAGKHKGYSLEGLYDGFETLMTKTNFDLLIDELKQLIDEQ